MDIALFDRHKKSCSTQPRSKIRSNQVNNGHDRRRPLTTFHHGRPLTYARAPKSRMQPCAGKQSKHMKQMISSWQHQTLSSFPSESAIFEFDNAENEDYVNSRFRFIIRNGPAVDEDGEVPWDRVEHVRVPTFDNSYACPICLDSLVAARITRCGHVFCLPCILHHLHERVKCRCPLCFASMDAADLRSMEFVKIQAVRVGDEVEMCLLTRDKSHTHPHPVDPIRTEIFSRFVQTDSIEHIVQKDLSELKLAAEACQCPITAAFINQATASVDSRVPRWDEVFCELDYDDSSDRNFQESSPNDYYFYQNCDGSPVFMHSLNYRSLVEEYGTDFPSVICGKVVEVLQYEQTEENRSRFRFLRHLPLSMIFYIAELDISEYLSEETAAKFYDETKSRQFAREEQQRHSEIAEKRQKRREELKQLETPPSALPLYRYDPYPVPEVGSIVSFPTLSSTPPSFTSTFRSDRPQRTPNRTLAQTSQDIPYSDEDNESENEQLLHSATPPDWNLIDFHITTKSKQKKQKPKNRTCGN